ncbi:dynein axonemal intermediate chain 4 [Pycnococcus provasolii]
MADAGSTGDASTNGRRASLANSSAPNSARAGTTSRRRSVVTASRRSRARGRTGDSSQTTLPDKIQVFDENGVDVTPKPLTLARISTGIDGVEGSDGVGSDSDSLAERMSSTGFSRSGGYSHSSDGESVDGDNDHTSLGGGKDGGKDGKGTVTSFVVVGPTVRGKPLSEVDLEAKVVRILEETETLQMFDQPSRCVAADHPTADAVTASNAAYAKLLKDKIGSENYVTGFSQTLPSLRKTKESQMAKVGTETVACEATAWDIADAFEEKDDGREEEDVMSPAPAGGAGAASSGKTGTSSLEHSIAASSDFLSLVASQNDEDERDDDLPKRTPLTDVPGLDAALAYMERAVTQNSYHDKMLMYRDFRILRAYPPKPGVMGIDLLWKFGCDLTKGRNVTCLAWNKVRRDVLAVGYGQLDFGEKKTGLVAFWSLKNPSYPDTWFECRSGVTALDWSLRNPSMLAVGTYDGGVSIFDGRAVAGGEPVLEATHNSGKHSDPVWKLHWVEKGSERGEALVSTSSDGRVVEWSTSKGLEYADIMKLKSLGPKKAVKLPNDENMSNAISKLNQKTEAFISRKASGMSFAFSPRDTTMYVVGTEEGLIHKCSCSYSEQYLETFRGHMGPVYTVAWSPFSQNGHFLSASADWTVRLWSEGREDPLLTFQSGNAAVTDMSWSPTNSTVFANVTADGRVEVWDLQASTLKPCVNYSSPSVKFSCMLFGTASPVLVAGGSDGSVCVFRLEGIERPEEEEVDGRKRLADALASNANQ